MMRVKRIRTLVLPAQIDESYRARGESDMGRIRRLVLDTLKPHEPSIIDMADQLSELEGIAAVNISIYEIDRRVENAKITIEGERISYPDVLAAIQEFGGAVHSIDEVVSGKMIIDDAVTPQG
jgi:hypothetical protein